MSISEKSSKPYVIKTNKLETSEFITGFNNASKVDARFKLVTEQLTDGNWEVYSTQNGGQLSEDLDLYRIKSTEFRKAFAFLIGAETKLHHLNGNTTPFQTHALDLGHLKPRNHITNALHQTMKAQRAYTKF